MRKLLLALPVLAACSSSPKTVREYVADGNLFEACVEAKERRSGDQDPNRRAVLGDALEAKGRVTVSARPLTAQETSEKLGGNVLDPAKAELWVLRFEHDLPRDEEVARLDLKLQSGGKQGSLSATPQDRGTATSAVPMPPEPPPPQIPDLYVAVPDTDVTLPKPWEEPTPDKPKAGKPKPPKKPKKAEVEAWEKDVEKAKKKHNELEEAKVEASKKAQADALAARAKLVDDHQALRKTRENAAQKLGDLIREAKCARDDEGFPVLRGQGVCEVVRVVAWSPGAPKGAAATLSLARRVTSGVQTCEAAHARTLSADGDGPVEKLLFASPRPTTDFKADP